MDRVAFGFSVYGNMFKLGYRPDCAVINTLVRGFCDNGLINDAKKFADEIMNNGLQPTVVTIGTIINGYCKRGDSQAALLFFQNVEKTMGCQPGQIEEALSIIIKLMLESGMKPDTHMFTSLIHWYCLLRKVNYARKIFTFKIAQGCVPNAFTYTTLIYGYYLLGKMDDAREMFEYGYVKDAVDLLQDMIGEGCMMDRVTYNLVIQGFLRHNETKRAVSYLESMVDAGFSASEGTSMKLVYLLATKDLDKASKEVLKKFFSLWNKKVRCSGRRGIKFRSNLCLVANELQTIVSYNENEETVAENEDDVNQLQDEVILRLKKVWNTKDVLRMRKQDELINGKQQPPVSLEKENVTNSAHKGHGVEDDNKGEESRVTSIDKPNVSDVYGYVSFDELLNQVEMNHQLACDPEYDILSTPPQQVCYYDHCFAYRTDAEMCNFVGQFLRLDSSSSYDVEKLGVSELLEVLMKESRINPFIISVKVIEKSILGNPDAYASLQSKLEKMLGNVVVIASHHPKIK
ncbi:hypothetical protein L2E82_12752 [Cichorium intybus]|uniref:Uncharacterized protein n=1 Tax=Cichorium intybus TaxID=13427 RepID=A0ACB9GHQ0_CICIN|nr:hypothetical protein L2E82_12752 [Cichorium intybus]